MQPEGKAQLSYSGATEATKEHTTKKKKPHSKRDCAHFGSGGSGGSTFIVSKCDEIESSFCFILFISCLQNVARQKKKKSAHTGKKKTYLWKTSSLPGSPRGPEAAFSITAATTHVASMVPPGCSSPLWRKRERGRKGEREKREGEMS